MAPCRSHDLISEQSKVQLIQEEDNRRSTTINDSINFVNVELNNLLQNSNPSNLSELEQKLEHFFHQKNAECLENYLKSIIAKHDQDNKPSEERQEQSETSDAKTKRTKTPSSPKSKPKSGNKTSSDAHLVQQQLNKLNMLLSINFHASYLQSFLSKAICLTATKLNNKSPFLYLTDFVNQANKIERFSMPVPMITVLHNGKGFAGKQYLIKEIILMPKVHLSVQEVSFFLFFFSFNINKP